MENIWILVGIVVLILLLGYFGRHNIKSLLGMNPAPTAVPVEKTVTPSTAAPSDNIYLTKSDPAKGVYLTDFAGMTLYTFDKDTTGVSNCYDACATAWPVYTSGATAQSQFPTNITVITRKDNSKQFAWKGMPLYYFAKDKKSGDVLGDGVNGVWHLVKP